MGHSIGVVEGTSDRARVVDVICPRVSRSGHVKAGEGVARGFPGKDRGGDCAGQQGQHEAASHGKAPHQKGVSGHVSAVFGLGR